MDHLPHSLTAVPPAAQDPAVARRHLLRSGAVLAGAAGLAAAGAVTGATPANAANGDPVTAGRSTAATTRTSLTLDAVAGRTQPTLELTNPSGAALELTALPDSWSGDLAVGQLASLPSGPVVGVDHGDGAENAYLALSLDLDALSLPVAIPPERILDTRSAGGRSNVLQASSTTAFDASGRLRAGQWLDLALAPTDQATIDGVFANLTVTGSLTSGLLSVYPTGDRPTASSLNFTQGQTIANAGLFATGLIQGYFVVRIYASATTHVLFDVTGYTGPATTPSLERSSSSSATLSKVAQRRAARRRSAARRTIKALGRR